MSNRILLSYFDQKELVCEAPASARTLALRNLEAEELGGEACTCLFGIACRPIRELLRALYWSGAIFKNLCPRVVCRGLNFDTPWLVLSSLLLWLNEFGDSAVDLKNDRLSKLFL